MSSLSISDATSRWTLSTPTSVSGGSAERAKDDEQDEDEDTEMRSRSDSPTPMPASPRQQPRTTDEPREWGGTTAPSAAMDEAGVVKPDEKGGTGAGADVWEDPE